VGAVSDDYAERLLAEKDAEIERLRAYVAEIEGRPVLLSEWEQQQAEIERLRGLLLEGITVPVQLNANAISPVAWRKDYERRVKEALGDE
jgi:hypothetical protein